LILPEIERKHHETAASTDRFSEGQEAEKPRPTFQRVKKKIVPVDCQTAFRESDFWHIAG